MNKNVDRISFYTKKVAQLGTVHPTKRNVSWYKRAERLSCYKKVLAELIGVPRNEQYES